MSKIYGNEKTIERAKKADAGDPIVYVNMEALDMLPDEYEIRIDEVKFDIESDFDCMGDGKYYPHTDLMNRIAEKRGIRGAENAEIETIIEDIDINPMLCKSIESPPTIRKTVIGKRMTKMGYVVDDDGTERFSPPCTVDFNVWERCVKAWTEEEEKTNGYDPARRKEYNGNSYYEYQYYDKKAKKQATGRLYPRYDTKWKRMKHFNELMLFAQRQADTKSRNIVIRTLTGMKTVYTADELKEGRFIFHRILRSREMLKLEAVARVDAISKGHRVGEEPTKMLYGVDPAAPGGDQQGMIDVTNPPVKQEEKKSDQQIMIEVLNEYKSDEETMRNIEDHESFDALLGWLEGNPDMNDEKNQRFWNKAIARLQEIESALPDCMKEEHTLY